MNEFSVTYTRHLIFRWLKETLTLTQWDITVTSDNSIFFIKAGSKTTTVPIEGLKKVELKSHHSLVQYIIAIIIVLFGFSCFTSLETFIAGIIAILLGVIIFLKGYKNELTFYKQENALVTSFFKIDVPYFEKDKLQSAQKAIRAVMAYETEKRDATRHTEVMADAVNRVADAIVGNPQPRRNIPSQRPSMPKTLALPQATKMTPQQQTAVLAAKKKALNAANAAQINRAKNATANKLK